MRRSAVVGAVVVLVVVAVGAAWAWSRSEDDPGSRERREAQEPDRDDLDGIGLALGCDVVDEYGGRAVLGAMAESAICFVDEEPVAGIHLARRAEAHENLLAYFQGRTQGPPGWPPCPDESPEEQAERFSFWVIAGGLWVVTTRDAAVRERAIAVGGEEADFSPAEVPPGSYPDIGGGDCPPGG